MNGNRDEKRRPSPLLQNAKFGDPGLRIYLDNLSAQMEMTTTFTLMALAVWAATSGASRLLGKHQRVKEVLEQVSQGAIGIAADMATIQSVGLAERHLLPQLARRGWLISPGVPWDEPVALLAIQRKDGLDAVEAHLLRRLDDEVCRRIVASFAKRKSFLDWSATFSKALRAQELGDHELAIPIWLIALDGIIDVEIGIANIFSKKYELRRAKMQARLLPGRSFKPLADAWLDVLSAFSQHSGQPNPAVLSRHAILHGNRPQIGTRKDSVQGILALEVLHHLLVVADSAKTAGANFGLAAGLPMLPARLT